MAIDMRHWLTSAVLPVEDIVADKRLRGVDEKSLPRLMESMRVVGLLSRIIVRYGSAMVGGVQHERVPILVAGLNRLEAARRLEWQKISADVIKCDEIEARLVEITENLDRSDLTPLE